MSVGAGILSTWIKEDIVVMVELEGEEENDYQGVKWGQKSLWVYGVNAVGLGVKKMNDGGALYDQLICGSVYVRCFHAKRRYRSGAGTTQNAGKRFGYQYEYRSDFQDQ